MIKKQKNIHFFDNQEKTYTESTKNLQTKLNKLSSLYYNIVANKNKKEQAILDKQEINEQINDLSIPFNMSLLSVLPLILTFFALSTSHIIINDFKNETVEKYGSFEAAEQKYVDLYSKTLNDKELQIFKSQPYYRDQNFIQFIYDLNNGNSVFASIYRNQKLDEKALTIFIASFISSIFFSLVLPPILKKKRKQKNQSKIDKIYNEINEAEKFLNEDTKKYLQHLDAFKSYSSFTNSSALDIKNVLEQHFTGKGYSQHLVNVVLNNYKIDFHFPKELPLKKNNPINLSDTLTYQVENDIKKIIDCVYKSKT